MVKNIKALVVDDELSVLESFKMILGIKDYEVVTAQNKEEAVEAAKKDSFTIAFIDLRFQGKDIGLEILKALKEVDFKLQAVIVTAYATEKTKMEALELGAFEYISKPFTMEAIYELVERAVEKQKK